MIKTIIIFLSLSVLLVSDRSAQYFKARVGDNTWKLSSNKLNLDKKRGFSGKFVINSERFNIKAGKNKDSLYIQLKQFNLYRETYDSQKLLNAYDNHNKAILFAEGIQNEVNITGIDTTDMIIEGNFHLNFKDLAQKPGPDPEPVKTIKEGKFRMKFEYVTKK